MPILPVGVMPFDAAVTDECCTRYKSVRHQTEVLCKPLLDDDFNLQASAEVSPPKWHLAHTTWFFEYFFLRELQAGYVEYDTRFAALFNSYYLAGDFTGGAAGIGVPARERRGLLSRPTLDQVLEYRHEIDQRVLGFLDRFQNSSAHQNPSSRSGKSTRLGDRYQILQRLALGLHHEQQHQELLLTDIKFNFSMNPLLPVYMASNEPPLGLFAHAGHMRWHDYEGGICELGSASEPVDEFEFEKFCFDNETPRHQTWLQPYALADRLISNGEYLEFVADGGYQRPEFWLSDGWSCVQQHGWEAPLYWQRQGDKWFAFTLHGVRPLQAAEPVHHVSYYEADAFARWAKARLPTEAEWENAAARQKICGHFIDDGILHPRAPCAGVDQPRQLFGDAWEWTSSHYSAYPGFKPATGAVGEYNGKFMCNQMVLRGGSCVTEREHIRAGYRNFFYPADRWQFSGIRLAR